ncbi:GntR family transcriptional regulator [Alicyclobacillus acidiphilus]|uniref:GntR family transcriptional regulator n=1 Tax=Alicyclobacillus acidiphilus TaxID=182455 RepID=UPI00082A3E96|nr:GntR family transcriptional regulator [Alicyclobacillus acidiphilus]
MVIGMVFGEGKKTLGEQAYEIIRENILTLRLKPGQTVYESEFSTMLNISRTPVREAVRALHIEQLIDVLPQRGMKIALISERKVEETRFVRESLEVSAICNIVDQWEPAQTKYQDLYRALASNLQSQKQVIQNGDAVQFLQADEAFHRLLLSAIGNATLVSVVSQMRGHLNRVRLLSLQEIPYTEGLVREHEQLLEALQSKDRDRATSILSAHLSRVSEDIQVVKDKYPDYFTD